MAEIKIVCKTGEFKFISAKIAEKVRMVGTDDQKKVSIPNHILIHRHPSIPNSVSHVNPD